MYQGGAVTHGFLIKVKRIWMGWQLTLIEWYEWKLDKKHCLSYLESDIYFGIDKNRKHDDFNKIKGV